MKRYTKNILGLILLVFMLSSCHNTLYRNGALVKNLKENYSYDSPKIDVMLFPKEILLKCEAHHRNKLKSHDTLELKRISLVEYQNTEYTLIEYDFKEVFDSRLVYIWDHKKNKLIGYFYRFLA